MSTKIEWTRGDDGSPGMTWNPVTGCEKVSPGCDHCYAATWAARRMGEWKGREFGDVRCHPDRLEIPLRRRKPTRYFVNSMSDLFHRDVPDEFICKVFDTMALAPQHTFQVLTKRPERMLRWVRHICVSRMVDPLPNVWLGVSIESNAYAWRAGMLRETPAAIRFISFEPLLGDVGQVNLSGIDWVIFGGESGPGARALWPWMVEEGVKRARAAGAAVFVKQLGSYWSKHAASDDDWRADPKGADIDRFPEHLRIREFPKTAMPA